MHVRDPVAYEFGESYRAHQYHLTDDATRGQVAIRMAATRRLECRPPSGKPSQGAAFHAFVKVYRLKVWAALGHGTGDVTLKPGEGKEMEADISWTMAALGARGEVIAPESGPALALTTDALWARTESGRTQGLVASQSDVTRLRLGLEGSWKVALKGDGSVTPRVEVGARHDGGDAETGSGVEVGGGIVWSDPGLGLSLDLSGRTLISHAAGDFEDRGYAASVVFDPDPASELGLSLALRQETGGAAAGGLDRLLAPEVLEARSGAETESRWQVEAAWGMALLEGQYIGSPHLGFGLARDARDYTLGWRLTPESEALDLSFGVTATRRESEYTAPQHTFGLQITLRW